MEAAGETRRPQDLPDVAGRPEGARILTPRGGLRASLTGATGPEVAGVTFLVETCVNA